MVNVDRPVHQESRENKVTKACPVYQARRVTVVNKATLVKTANLDTTDNKVKMVQLVYPVFLEKWVPVVSPAREVFQVYQDHQEYLEVKVQPALKVTLDLLVDPELPVRLDPTVQLVHPDLRECWDHLVLLAQEENLVCPVFLVLTVYRVLPVTPELPALKVTLEALDLRCVNISTGKMTDSLTDLSFYFHSGSCWFPRCPRSKRRSRCTWAIG